MSEPLSNKDDQLVAIEGGSDWRPFLSRKTQFLLHEAQKSGHAVYSATSALAEKATRDIDLKGLAGGVVAMSAGEALGMAVGGAVGSVAGPAGAIVGAQIGGFAGTSLGARYGYDCAADGSRDVSLDPGSAHKEPEEPTVNVRPSQDIGPQAVLTVRFAERVGESLGEVGGRALGSVVGGAKAGNVMGALGVGLGGSLGEATQVGAVQPDQTEKSYRQAPTRAWFERIAKERLSETVLSGVFGSLAGMVAGPMGEKLGRNAGAVAASRLKWGKSPDKEFIDMDVDPDTPSNSEPSCDGSEQEGMPRS